MYSGHARNAGNFRNNESTGVQNPHCYMYAWLIVYAYQEYWTTYPAPEQGSGTVLFRVSAWSRSRGKAPGYVTIQTESFCDIPKLNYALESHCLFTLSLHWQLTSEAQNGNQSCSWGTCRCHTSIDWQQLLHCWAGLTWPLFLMPIIPWMRTFSQTTLTITLPQEGSDGQTKIAKQLQ